MSKIIIAFLLGFFALLTNVTAKEASAYPPYEYERVSFVGGNEALQSFIADNLVYPELCRENIVEGSVKAKLFINKDGEVTNFEILQSLDELCDAEVERVINTMPKWKPAKYNGHSIPSKIIINFRFQLDF